MIYDILNINLGTMDHFLPSFKAPLSSLLSILLAKKKKAGIFILLEIHIREVWSLKKSLVKMTEHSLLFLIKLY